MIVGSGLAISEYLHSRTRSLPNKALLVLIFRKLLKLILREKGSKYFVDPLHFVNNLTTGPAGVDQSPEPQ
ncbi:conserved hypothetical protein (plasmid) [Corynebacterium efficiens YS-314]|uniref:Uncharacterized protein n=1 Tax=Corynebacterium efficiens (strain DSM 44549 / YS-314 / AJ 12310 / JCM 11189 / NBRC 100395) TaxID=196164 RepID=Q8FLE9_COREF|nr:conserved hypothetical protein [Corynebacterium efficiens YS-314]